MRKYSALQKVLALVLTLVLMIGLLPSITMSTKAESVTGATAVADPGTAANWETFMGTDQDGARYAGRVWVDKSVYVDDAPVYFTESAKQSSTASFTVDLQDEENFQVIFSALGSSLASNITTTETQPLDVVLVLDNSVSMNTNVGSGQQRKTRMEYLIEAANKLLEDLLAVSDIRLGIASYARSASTVLPFGTYTNGVRLNVTNPSGGSSSDGVITAVNSSGQTIDRNYKSGGYEMYTNVQAGFNLGMEMLATAANVENRKPIVILLTDGAANTALDTFFVDGQTGTSRQEYSGTTIDPMIALSTLLSTAYNKARVENHYNQTPYIYGVGVDLSTTDGSNAIINPKDNFNSSNTNSNIREAYSEYQTWSNGTDVTDTRGSGRNQYKYTFGHDYPNGISLDDIKNNINYVDKYYPVSGAELGATFDSISSELTQNAFNPITSSKPGVTGVENTPLIYADNIGRYMEVKNVQAIRVFDQTIPVTKNSNGTYSVDRQTGQNPTTNEVWNSAEDIDVRVVENADGTQQLRIYINQEILPILLDKVEVVTEDNVTTRTITTTEYEPLRVFYTVGIQSDILIDGKVDTSKIDSEYLAAHTVDGKINFYSNNFAVLNDEDKAPNGANGNVDLGDAHVGFVPSHENRFYYYQSHHEIFKSVKYQGTDSIPWEDGEYGALWNSTDYQMEVLTYADCLTTDPAARVYTYVTFHRPVGAANAAGTAVAEEVTYLIRPVWSALKGTISFYDTVNEVFLNDGLAVEQEQVAAYLAANTNVTANDLVAVQGLQSRRVSRLNNMFQYKTTNETGTADLAYAPTYSETSHNDNDAHENSEILVWLGNNGKLSVPAATGIKITKNVTEFAAGDSADTKFPITVSLYNINVTPSVVDANGNALAANKYSITNNGSINGVDVTIQLVNGESAYILNLAGDTLYDVTESASQYDYTYSGATKTVANTIVEGVVTNEPVKPGGLYITKEVEHATTGETIPTDKEFRFEVYLKDASGNNLPDQRFDCENNHEESLKEVECVDGKITGGLCHGETIYIKDIPAGTVVTVVEEDLPADGNYTLKNYRSRNQTGEDADDDGVVTIVSGANATVVVTNTYTPKATTANVNVVGTKTFEWDTPVEATFTFHVQYWDGDSWENLSGKTGSVQYDTNSTEMTQTFTITDVLAGITYEKAGTYSYQIVEDIPENKISGLTYDPTIHTFTVTVVDDNGQLKATVATHHEELTATDGVFTVKPVFVNEYETVSIVLNVQKVVEDTSNNPSTPKAGFSFVAVETESDWTTAVTDGEGNEIKKVEVSDAFGKAHFTATYTEVGTHYFVITEQNDGKTNWTYSPVQHKIIVNITEDGADQLVATITDAEGNVIDKEIEFKNTYDPTDATVDVGLLVKKSLAKAEGLSRTLEAGEFSFAVFENGKANHSNIDEALLVGTNDADGNVTFTTVTNYGKASGLVDEDNKTLRFAKVGDYFFDVVELSGSEGGITYDSTIYDLVVEVADNGDGTLAANYYYEDAVSTTVTFTNNYAATPTTAVITGTKTLVVSSGNKTLKPGDYSFELYKADDNGNATGEAIETVTNRVDDTFAFTAITYNKPGEYKYVVKEVIPAGANSNNVLNGVTYAKDPIGVTVNVTDNEEGALTAVVVADTTDNKINFVNTYSATSASVTLTGEKLLEGREWTDTESFQFQLFEANERFEIADGSTAKQTDEATKTDPSIAFNFSLNTLGNHYFVIKEVVPAEKQPALTYDANEYHVTVTVSDSGNGQMSAQTAVVFTGNPGANIGAGQINFTNRYRPVDAEFVIEGTKLLVDGPAIKPGEFEFELYSEAGNLLQTVPVRVVAGNANFAFEPITYTAEDVNTSITYTVKEKQGDNAKVGYDQTAFTVVVTVKDDIKDGELEITKVVKNGDTEAELTFTNTYKPDAITYTIKAEKKYTKELTGGEFAFKLEGEIDGVDVTHTVKNADKGAIAFNALTFNKAGVYEFTVKELKDNWEFIQWSAAEYKVTITVVNTEGVLSVVEPITVEKTTGSADEGNLTFINNYQFIKDGDVLITGTKTISGFRSAVKEGEFQFGLYDAQGKQVGDLVKNDANGNFAFPKLTFKENDVGKTYTYTVKEIRPEVNGVAQTTYRGMTYDTDVFTVVVKVTDGGEGDVVATYTINDKTDGKIVFENKYEVTAAKVTLEATKTYDKGLSGNDFTFKLEGEIDGTKVDQSKKNDANGKIKFDELTFTKEGTYTFKVKEKDELLGFISYSKAVYTVTITVQDNGAGELVATTKVNDKADGKIAFENVYKMVDADNELTLTGSKTLTGRDQVAGEFAFGLYDANGKLLEKVTNAADGSFAFTKLVYEVKSGETLNYTYTVKEIAGTDPLVTYDATVYTVKVAVKDNGKGEAELTYTINDKADGKIVFANTYTAPADVVAKINIQKKVINKTESAIGLDGFSFQLQNGDQKLSVKSDKDGKASFLLTFSVEDVGKTFEVKVKEVKGKTAGMTYDTTVHTVKVKVSQNADGSLALTVNDKATDAASLTFTNTYEPNATPITGDNFPVLLLIVVLVLSMMAMVVLVMKRKAEMKKGKYL